MTNAGYIQTGLPGGPVRSRGHGVLIQSIGGGGGNVGKNSLTALPIFNEKAEIRGLDRVLLTGASGDGGDIVIDHSGRIVINGDNSFGIFAQSIGGSGGSADLSINSNPWIEEFRKNRDKIANSLERFLDAADAIGKKVELKRAADDLNERLGRIDTANGLSFGANEREKVLAMLDALRAGLDDIKTLGDREIADAKSMIADALKEINDSLFSFSDYSGRGGDITVNSSGDIIITGRNSIAYFAQSVGGKGGFAQIGDNRYFGSVGGAGDAGTVTINHTGRIIAGGENGIGFLAQSASAGRGGAMTISLDNDVIGGTGDGAGLWLDGGAANLVTLRGLVTALNGQAIIGGAGDDRITSYGTIVGDVRLGKGANTLAIAQGARFITGDVIDLGGGLLTNAGALHLGPDWSPLAGAAGAVSARELDGDLILEATSTLFADITFDQPSASAKSSAQARAAAAGAMSDMLKISGSATLAGDANITVVSLAGLQPALLLTALGGIRDLGLTIKDTPILDYDLKISGDSAWLSVAPDFSLAGFNRNQTALGDHLNEAVAVGGAAGLGPLLAAIGNSGDLGAIAANLDAVAPEPYLSLAFGAMRASERLGESLEGCHARRVEAVLRGPACWFAFGGGGEFDVDRGAQRRGFEESFKRFGGGVTLGVSPEFFVSLAARQEWAEFDSFELAKASRSGVGIQGAFVTGPWRLEGAFAADFADHDVGRSVETLLFSSRALADPKIRTVTGALKAAYGANIGTLDVGAHAGARIIDLNMRRFEERGELGAWAAVVDGDDRFYKLESGVDLAAAWTSGALEIRPSVRLGGAYYPRSRIRLINRFSGSPQSAGDFATEFEFDGFMADLSIGAELANGRNWALRLGYDGEFGASVREHAGDLRFVYRFAP